MKLCHVPLYYNVFSTKSIGNVPLNASIPFDVYRFNFSSQFKQSNWQMKITMNYNSIKWVYKSESTKKQWVRENAHFMWKMSTTSTKKLFLSLRVHWKIAGRKSKFDWNQKKRASKFDSITLPTNVDGTSGYHVRCYKYFCSVKEKKEECPSKVADNVTIWFIEN